MGLLKNHLIGIREELEKTYDLSFCSKCNGTGFITKEIYGDGENFEWDVIDEVKVNCDECF